MFKKYRKKLIQLHDLLVVILALILAFFLRYNFDIPPFEIRTLFYSISILVIVHLITSFFIKLHHSTWRYFGFDDLKKIILLSLITASIIASIALFLRISVPRSVLLMFPFFSIIFLGSSRYVYRFIKETNKEKKQIPQNTVIIYGAGAAAAGLVKDLRRSNSVNITAFIDDNKSLHGRNILDIYVYGGLSDLKTAVTKYQADTLILAIPSISIKNKRKIISAANKLNLKILSIPSIEDLISGKVTVSNIKPLMLEDVLGRSEVKLDIRGIKKLIHDNIVLVSGAGGSIGSEICRQIISFKPSQLICIDISEFSLYQIEQEFSNSGIKNITYLVGDVKNEKRINSIFTKFKPKIVFHAAAYKHVPLMENLNVSEVFNNNVLGTYILANESINSEVNKFVLISTDKAVSPTNVMGASKHLSEMICQILGKISNTSFITVRFGNVLGSSGSVIPKFQQQIQTGGPITITHPRIKRFFMTIPEASKLVLQASMMGKGGEIFILDMGKQIKIVDLAKALIAISGFGKNKIKIKYTGLRAGEKLYEELFSENEKIISTDHPKLSVAIFEKNYSIKWMKDMISWISQIEGKEEYLVKKELKSWVKDYRSIDSISH